MSKWIARTALFLTLTTAGTTSHAQTAPTTALTGRWTNKEHNRVLEFVPSGKSYEAIVREAEDKALIGKKQITGLVYNGKSFTGGTLHLLKRNRSFACSLIIRSATTMDITVSAGLMSKTQTWTKVNR